MKWGGGEEVEEREEEKKEEGRKMIIASLDLDKSCISIAKIKDKKSIHRQSPLDAVLRLL